MRSTQTGNESQGSSESGDQIFSSVSTIFVRIVGINGLFRKQALVKRIILSVYRS